MNALQPAPTSLPVLGFLRRMVLGAFFQKRNLKPEPETRLEGMTALVTGGNGGIGYQIALGMARRGADLVLVCRNMDKAEHAAAQIREETGRKVSLIPCDLADLEQVVRAAQAVTGPIDRVVLNAGLWPLGYTETKQGFESAFGVNVLAHTLFVHHLLKRQVIADRARWIWMTGDIYAFCRRCTPDYRYRGPFGGWKAYCRSKLGNLWLRALFAERWPEYGWYAAHPGAVDSGLGNQDAVPLWLRPMDLIPASTGAWTPIYCASEPDLTPGYYHNVHGCMRLAATDAANDRAAAEQLWDQLQGLLQPYL